MDKKRLRKLRRELDELRIGKYNLKTSDLVRFAGKVGRKENTLRGKEPTFISVPFPELRPLSISSHKTINPHTANAILDSLEADLNKWEDSLEAQERKTNGNDKKLPPETICTDSDPSGT
jgi:hypothetical protein